MGLQSESDIAEARSEFFEEGRLPSDRVGHAVLRSWIRCSDMGLKARATPAPDPLPVGDMRQLADRHGRFTRLCRPELEMLSTEARDTGSLVILTDAAGMILDTLGDAAFAGRAAQVALRPGVDWSEGNTGTNAIGVALAERRAVAVHGGEHFFSGHQLLSCAATPIFDPRGAVLGALDISGSSRVQQVHALGLVRMAVSQIEHRLLGQRFEGCRILRLHSDPTMLGTVREGALVFRDDLLVAANRRGLGLVGLAWDALDITRFGAIFDGAPCRMALLSASDAISIPPCRARSRPRMNSDTAVLSDRGSMLYSARICPFCTHQAPTFPARANCATSWSRAVVLRQCFSVLMTTCCGTVMAKSFSLKTCSAFSRMSDLK